MLGHATSLDGTVWPDYIPQMAEEEQVDVVIQINGRVRGRMRVDSGLGEEELVELAMKDPRIEPLVRAMPILKRVVVPNRLVNLVIS